MSYRLKQISRYEMVRWPKWRRKLYCFWYRRKFAWYFYLLLPAFFLRWLRYLPNIILAYLVFGIIAFHILEIIEKSDADWIEIWYR